MIAAGRTVPETRQKHCIVQRHAGRSSEKVPQMEAVEGMLEGLWVQQKILFT
jgi:hypothetical protein